MVLQSWTKVLVMVMQYSYFSVISGFAHKKGHSFSKFSRSSPPPTLYKVETWREFFLNHFVGRYRNSECHTSIWNFNIYTLTVFVLEMFNTRFAVLTCTVSAASTHA